MTISSQGDADANKYQGTIIVEELPEDKTLPAQLQSRIQFPETAFTVDESEHAPELKDEVVVEKPMSKRWLWFGIGFVVLGIVELAVSLVESVKSQSFLGIAWFVLLLSVLLYLCLIAFREFRSLINLKARVSTKEKALMLSQSPAIGEAGEFCTRIQNSILADESSVSNWQKAVQSHHSDKEIMQLFEQIVVHPLDEKVQRVVTRESGACAALIGISPFIALDMLIVVWRNLKMVKTVSDIYGVPLGWCAKINLLKQIFKQLVYAGASELLSDASVWAMGGSMSAKLSSKLAQGLGAGVLTARMGILTVKACRPMPYVSCTPLSISKIGTGIIHQLKPLDS